MIRRLFRPRESVNTAALREGQMAAAHAVIEAAGITRLSDDDDGCRLAIHCADLGNPLWRSGCRDDIAARIAKAWPALDTADCNRLISHINARVQLAVEAPSRDKVRMRDAMTKARGNWVQSWRIDSHDVEGA